MIFSKRRPLSGAILLAVALTQTAPACAESSFVTFRLPHVPNYVGFGAGAYPQYVGSSDIAYGAVPFARVSWGDHRYLEIDGNYADLNLLDDPNWRFGPAGLLRLGRRHADNDAVDALPDIDPALELGLFAGYQFAASSDPRDRWWLGADVTQDVTSAHGGYVASVSVHRWLPVRRYAALGLSLGADYGSSDYENTFFSITPEASRDSGLPVYEAAAGLRDLEATVVFVQPLSERWVAGLGVQYTRLLGDSADSPIVTDGGSANQFVYGFGLARIF
ncbi:MAG: MipA/OmpV family protein [Rhodobacteraceae bacterium]|nr:MipA/OmpV family protein [Paracoccaceae bacterium]